MGGNLVNPPATAHPNISRPVYIMDRRFSISVECDALKVAEPERADLFIPFCRVSRVIADPGVAFAPSVLMRLAELGICVSWIQKDGTSIATLLPHFERTAGSSLAQRLLELAQMDDCFELYNRWIKVQYQRASWEISTQLKLRSTQNQSRLLEIEVDNMEQELVGLTAPKTFRLMFLPLCESKIRSTLAANHIGKGALWTSYPADLAHDLAKLLYFRLARLRIGYFKRCTYTQSSGTFTPELNQVARLFESKKALVDRLLDQLLHRLELWAITSLYP